MIDRLVHHAEILALKGDSYRLKDRDLARPAATEPARTADSSTGTGYACPAGISQITRQAGCIFNRRKGVHLQPALTLGSP